MMNEKLRNRNQGIRESGVRMMNEKLRNGEWEIGNKAYEWGMEVENGEWD
jgi:hypothetical protein